MEPKKNPKYDLTRYSGLFLEVGLVVAISAVLFALNYSVQKKNTAVFGKLETVVAEEGIIPITRQQTETPPPEIPKVAEVIHIVDDDVDIEDDADIEDIEPDQETDVIVVERQEEEEDEDEIFIIVDEIPEFPGGEDALHKYMIEHTISGAYTGAVYFYINSDAQISESFSNATRPSEIAGRVNNISDKAAEIQFLLGGAMGAVGASWLTSGLGKEGEDLLNSFKYSGLGGESNNIFGLGNSTGAGIFNSLIKNLSTMVSGSKMIFPEIWADSNFGRSYNVTIKLVSPDCDRLSIYLNIFVPLVHLLGFVLPRSTASNAYTSPFLVQCWYKSMFHIDLGMITSCDIVKGETGAWTEEGLPTQVTVQLQIKDLYQVLSQASGVNGNHILSNPAQMDYFANLCGVNIHATDVIRTVTLWYTMLNNGLQDDLLSIPTNTLRSISNSFFNLFP